MPLMAKMPRACLLLVLCWSAIAYDWEETTTSTAIKTMEFDFGAPSAPAAYQPIGVTPVPEDKQVGLAVGIGTAAAAAAGGVGMAIYAAHEASKPEVITRIVTPAPKVVYVPAQVEIDVLSNGQTVNPPPGATTPHPMRLYADSASTRVEDDSDESSLKRGDMVMLIFGLALAGCCCVSSMVVYCLFCSSKRKKRALGEARFLQPAATAPIRRKDKDATKVARSSGQAGDKLCPEFLPGPLGMTLDHATGVVSAMGGVNRGRETGEILDIKPGGQAHQSGMLIGDVITKLNGYPFTIDLLDEFQEGAEPYDMLFEFGDQREHEPLDQEPRTRSLKAPWQGASTLPSSTTPLIPASTYSGAKPSTPASMMFPQQMQWSNSRSQVPQFAYANTAGVVHPV